MAWEMRGKHGPYYTRSVRRNGRVEREYLGKGPTAALAAALDEEQAVLRKRERRQRPDDERVTAADALLAELAEAGEQLSRLALRAVGYHQHHRGEWRRKRVAPKKPATVTTTAAPAPEDLAGKALVAVIRQAEAGDRDALARVRAAFDLHPKMRALYGDMGEKAERILIGIAAGKNELMRQSMEDHLAELRRELEGANPTPLERLLVQRVVLCWFRANFADLLEGANTKGSPTFRQAEHDQKRQERAHRQFLAAAKNLAVIRRLALPALQVNIAAEGGQQVNVGSMQAPGAMGRLGE